MKAETIAAALGGRKVGSGWAARCPAHDDHAPSLSIRDAGDGKALVRCHAGCGQEQVISVLRSRGLWTSNGPHSDATDRPNIQHKPDQDDTKRAAGGIWPAMVALVTKGADGTPLAIHRTYLASDGAGKAPVEPAKMMLGPCRGGACALPPSR